MTETQQEDSNKKLLEDLDFLQNLWEEQKQKQKQLREGSLSRNREGLQNTSDKNGKNRSTEKRYKTSWEAGEENTKSKYDRRKSPNRDRSRGHQDREVRKPYTNYEKTHGFQKQQKSRKFRDERNKGFDSLDEKIQTHFSKLNDKAEQDEDRNFKYRETKRNKYDMKDHKLKYKKEESETSLKDENDRKSQLQKEGGITKRVNWELDNQPLEESKRQEDYHNREADVKEDHTKSDKSWETNRSRSTDTSHKGRESSGNRANGIDNVEEGTSPRHSESNDHAITNRNWEKREQTSSGRRNKRYKEFRSLKGEDKETLNKFQTQRYKEPYSEESRRQRTNWKWGNRGESPSDDRNQGYKEYRGRRSDNFEKGNNKFNSRDHNEPKYFEESRNKGSNWKWDRRGLSPSENRNQRYKEFRGDRFEKRNNKFNSRSYNEPKFFEESRNRRSNWKWDRRGQSPSGERNQPYGDHRGRNSDKFREKYDEFKSRDYEDYKDNKGSKYQGPKRKFDKKGYNSTYPNQKGKENNDQETSRIPDMRSMEMIRRQEWGAPKTKWGIGPPLKFPLKFIFCMPTNKNRCFTLKQCTKELLYLHERHMKTPTCPDIKYSFFIGSDGSVYECRGWRTRPGLPQKYEKSNKDSLFIAFAGKYNQYSVPPAMIKARDYVIDYGLKNDLIDEDYTIRSAVDHANKSESEVDYDHNTDDQETEDQKTEDHKTEYQETEDQKTEYQKTEDQKTEAQGGQYEESRHHKNKKSSKEKKKNQNMIKVKKKDQEEQTQDQEEVRETDDQETHDQETDYQTTDGLKSEDYETDHEQYGGQEGYPTLGSDWEKQMLEHMSSGSETSGTVKSWVSYTSSWDLSEGDFDKEELIGEDRSGADI